MTVAEGKEKEKDTDTDTYIYASRTEFTFPPHPIWRSTLTDFQKWVWAVVGMKNLIWIFVLDEGYDGARRVILGDFQRNFRKWTQARLAWRILGINASKSLPRDSHDLTYNHTYIRTYFSGVIRLPWVNSLTMTVASLTEPGGVGPFMDILQIVTFLIWKHITHFRAKHKNWLTGRLEMRKSDTAIQINYILPWIATKAQRRSNSNVIAARKVRKTGVTLCNNSFKIQFQGIMLRLCKIS